MPVEQHGLDLPDAARPAWAAYCEMLASKDAHFGYLEELHRKVEHGGRRTLSETAYLERLLATHDRCVTHFATAMRDLGKRDADTHARLVAAIAELNQSLGSADSSGPN